jgi:hypothetical protein
MVDEILSQTKGTTLYGEQLFNRVVVEAWRRGVIDELKVTKDEFTRLLEERDWRYVETKHVWVRGVEHASPKFWEGIRDEPQVAEPSKTPVT